MAMVALIFISSVGFWVVFVFGVGVFLGLGTDGTDDKTMIFPKVEL